MVKLSLYLIWKEETIENSIISWTLIFDEEKEVASITKNGIKVVSVCEDINFTDKSTFASNSIAFQHMKDMKKFINQEIKKLGKY